MKTKLKPYLLRLIKENIYYIIGVMLIFLLTIVVTKIGIDKIISSNKKIKQLTIDVRELDKKVKLYETSIPPSEKLNEDIKLLNSLIPNIEDYFSIIYSLEQLSQKTGFTIIDYSVNVGKSTANKLKLVVTGIGDSNSFLKFLDEYKFGGGRLITSDKIELSPQLSGSIKLDLTFYSKSINLKNEEIVITNTNLFSDIEAIKKKVNFQFNSPTTPETDLLYPRKTNPF